MELHARGVELIGELREVAKGTLMKWTGLGSIMNVTFTTTPVGEIGCPEDFGEPVRELGDFFASFPARAWVLYCEAWVRVAQSGVDGGGSGWVCRCCAGVC
jgi:hypothetical protein